MARERIGIMGGIFDPVHSGHLSVASLAMSAAKLDRVLFVPDGRPPHKTPLASPEDRLTMLKCALLCDRRFGVEDAELLRDETTYPHIMLSDIHQRYPKADLFYIIGADALLHVSHWHELETVFRMCTFLVAPRTAAPSSVRDMLEERRKLAQLGAHIQFLDIPLSDISSTEIRDALERGEDPPLLPVPLREYCCVRALYGLPARIPSGTEWLARLGDALTLKRFSHSLAVAYTAKNLARNHGVSPLKAEIAGLLHDCAKCMPLADMQALCKSHSLTSDSLTLSSGSLLHAIAGSYLAATEYGVQDPDILRAISCHTTGKIGMTKLDMVIYLADKIEPTRPPYPSLNKVRMLAPLSLERAMLVSLEGTRDYVRHNGRTLHPQTDRTLNWLRTLPAVKGTEVH